MTSLRYVVVNAGQCRACGEVAGEHGVDGRCPMDGRSYFSGDQVIGFVDLESEEVRAWLKQNHV